MTSTDGPTDSPTDSPGAYEIRIAVRLDLHWQEWFAPLDLIPTTDGSTLLRGVLPDQAALHGILRKIRDAGMPLISVTPITGRTTS